MSDDQEKHEEVNGSNDVQNEKSAEQQVKPDTSEKVENQIKDGDQVVSSEPSKLEKSIIRQIEFYFGDRNLVKDKFLQEKIKSDPDGWVTLEVLLTFNRLKSLTTDPSIICGAIRKSTSGLLEVNADGNSIRRANTSGDNLPSIGLLSPEVRKEMKGRTLHLKGFPEDSSFDDIQEFLLQFGETVLIQLRRYTPEHENARKFKGSLFVEFKDVVSVAKVMEVDKLKYKDSELFVETKEQYLKRQNLKRKKPSNETDNSEEEPKAKVKKEEEEKEYSVGTKNAVIYFKGCGPDTKREAIKELFNHWSEVAWVEFEIGNTEGYVRLDEEGGAKKVYEGMTKDGSTPQICGTDTELRVLEGDEELEYWKRMLEDVKRKKQRKSGGNRSGRGRGGGYRKGPRRRNNTNED